MAYDVLINQSLTNSIPTVPLNQEQIRSLVNDHCCRVVDGWDSDTLMEYAISVMVDSFDKDPGTGVIDMDMLVEDIINHEGGDCGSAYEFLVGAGVDEDTADALINNSSLQDSMRL